MTGCGPFNGLARMRRLRILCLLLPGLVLLSPVASRAAEFPPAFVVSDVPVAADGKTGAQARDAARNAGEVTALQDVLQRLTAKQDWPHLPAPDQDTTTNLLADFQVQKEHVAPTHYVGIYTFRFDPAGVRQLLHTAGIGFSELVSKPVVLVPLYRNGGAVHLWDDPNPWRDAWNLANNHAGLVPWSMPLGDIGDVQAFDVAQAEAPTPQQLATLSQRYDGGDPVVASAVETDAPQGGATLQITVTRYAAAGNDSTTVSVTGDKPDARFYAAGVDAARRALEDLWKKNATLPSLAPGDGQPFQVTVPLASAKQWAQIRARLAKVDGVQDPQILMIAHDQIVLLLKLAADPGAMRIAFAQQDLVLTPSDGGATLQLATPGMPLPTSDTSAAPADMGTAPAVQVQQPPPLPPATGVLAPPSVVQGTSAE
jgi:hypothetical protein